MHKKTVPTMTTSWECEGTILKLMVSDELTCITKLNMSLIEQKRLGFRVSGAPNLVSLGLHTQSN
jgi:hypothetical protein